MSKSKSETRRIGSGLWVVELLLFGSLISMFFLMCYSAILEHPEWWIHELITGEPSEHITTPIDENV